jgi:hypothetical protein
VDNNYLDLGMNKSGFVHTLPQWQAYLEAPGRILIPNYQDGI